MWCWCWVWAKDDVDVRHWCGGAQPRKGVGINTWGLNGRVVRTSKGSLDVSTTCESDGFGSFDCCPHEIPHDDQRKPYRFHIPDSQIHEKRLPRLSRPHNTECRFIPKQTVTFKTGKNAMNRLVKTSTGPSFRLQITICSHKRVNGCLDSNSDCTP
ncbi:hypothetical protein EX30DRAFT_32727 [Ascodesmis nigricans]|uniref:Uncharacterized protein n=1 Tax=Ascodesmis nigricans TaxID=341454 RepID=A0A4S2MWE7_9PEZI|nr:hypothetical protein EX30DRAFT_32727 [Ascodesmis nigricans]